MEKIGQTMCELKNCLWKIIGALAIHIGFTHTVTIFRHLKFLTIGSGE